jgi:hypothetical protein
MSHEDAESINNQGVDLLEAGDAAGAEKLFRQAVALDPKRWLFRNNLFVALRRTSRLYRLLTLPGLAADGVHRFMRRYRWALYLVLFVLLVSTRLLINIDGIHAGWIYAAPGLVIFAWLIFFWPLTRFYEFLVLRDIRAKAKRNPIQGISLGFKFTLFLLFMIGVWTALGWALTQEELRLYAIGAVLIWILPFAVAGWIRNWKEKRRMKERRIEASEKMKKYHRMR